MAAFMFDILIAILTTITPCVLGQPTDTRLVVKIPIDSIRERGVLAIHCNIWNLDEDAHHVKILRELTTGATQVISYNELIVASDLERAFIAKRTLFDGSLVYFLSIIKADRSDSGIYSCKVTRSSDDVVVAQQRETVDVQYFPDEENPRCHPGSQGPILVKVGKTLVLNCTSEMGDPPVKFHWSNTRTGAQVAGVSPKDYSGSQDALAYSELILFPSKNDDNTLFLCTMTSIAFPGRESSCHVGPVIVIDNDGSEGDELDAPPYTPAPVTTDRTRHRSTSDKVLSDINSDVTRPDKTSPGDTTQCTCDNTDWVIITYSVGAFALLLLIMTLIMSVAYKLSMNRNSRRLPTYRMPDDVYSNVRERNQHLYMSLDRKMAVARSTAGGQTQLPKLESGFT